MGQDLVGGLGPCERMATIVPAVDEPTDRLGELPYAPERPAPDGLAGDDREEHLDHVQPRARGRGEVQRDPRCTPRPPFAPVSLVTWAVVCAPVQLAPPA